MRSKLPKLVQKFKHRKINLQKRGFCFHLKVEEQKRSSAPRKILANQNISIFPTTESYFLQKWHFMVQKFTARPRSPSLNDCSDRVHIFFHTHKNMPQEVFICISLPTPLTINHLLFIPYQMIKFNLLMKSIK